jgi:hypothetical protein
LIPESNIIEKINSWNEKEYDISNLQLNIGDYTFVSQFVVRSLCDDSDIILGSPLDGNTRVFHPKHKEEVFDIFI